VTPAPPPSPSRPARAASVDRREIVSLAVPAFLALVAEPVFLAADSAIVGHLGTIPLAGLGVAGSVLTAAAGIFVFLAYATTSVVARAMGAGSPTTAITAGLDGLWLALGLGAVAAIAVAATADPLSAAFGASAAVHEQATSYLRIGALGLPAMLVLLAVTGALRGLLDTRTPMLVAVVGFSVNIALNLVFIHGLHWGIAGSAWGTVIAQTGMALALTAVLLRQARATRAPLRPHPGRVLAAARTGIPLVVRTLALRGAILLTVWAAAVLGDAPLAAHQIAATVWTFLAFALDALAIAAQAVVGRDLGAGRVEAARAVMRTLLRAGMLFGLAVGVLTAASAGVLPRLFTSDPAAIGYAVPALLVVAVGQVVSGYVFVADGVLMGAGDFRYLAWAMGGALAAYAPVVLFVRALGVWGEPGRVLMWLWGGYVVFMLARAVSLGWRLRGDRWLIPGA
jgi:putative MATE family efflux protein